MRTMVMEPVASTSSAADEDGGTALALCAGALAAIDAQRLEAWEGLGLTMSQVRFLHVLSQPHRRPPRASEIAAALRVHPATVTYMTDRLGALGLVRRSVDRRDHRVKHVELTEKGRSVLRGEGVIAEGVLAVIHEAPAAALDAAQRALERVTHEHP